jgi:hypothetical protein
MSPIHWIRKSGCLVNITVNSLLNVTSIEVLMDTAPGPFRMYLASRVRAG